MPSNPGKLAVLASIGLLRDRFFALLKLAPSSVKVSSMTKSFSWKALAWIPFLAVLSCGTFSQRVGFHENRLRDERAQPESRAHHPAGV